ncbi:hypothetical protein PO124_23055 [Bacillus licheniformis]|nr:hypothetical protein [Bacillus licheniformis]
MPKRFRPIFTTMPFEGTTRSLVRHRSSSSASRPESREQTALVHFLQFACQECNKTKHRSCGCREEKARTRRRLPSAMPITATAYVSQPIPLRQSSVKRGSIPPAIAPLKLECHCSRGTRNRPTAKTGRKNKEQHPE